MRAEAGKKFEILIFIKKNECKLAKKRAPNPIWSSFPEVVGCLIYMLYIFNKYIIENRAAISAM